MTNGDHSSQLNAAQQFDLNNLIASFRMEGMEFSAAQVDVLAQQILGKLTRAETVVALNALDEL